MPVVVVSVIIIIVIVILMIVILIKRSTSESLCLAMRVQLLASPIGIDKFVWRLFGLWLLWRRA